MADHDSDEHLPVNVPPPSDDDKLSDDDDEATRNYIVVSIKHRQCCKYVKDMSSSLCQCGRGINWHDRKEVPRGQGQNWDPETHSELVSGGPTTFGRIEFPDQKEGTTAQYVRLDYKTAHEDVKELLIKHWGLSIPQVVISLIGTPGNLPSEDKEQLRRSLLKSATTTNAWIVTEGTGPLAEFVGNATSHSEEKVVLLGISHWGIVENKGCLEGEQNEGKYPAKYFTSQPTGTEGQLQPNHTHFLLVDDGTVNSRYQNDIRFRAEFQKYLQDHLGGSVEVPVVTLLVGGDVNSITRAVASASNGTPIVVFEGSGGAADLVAQAFHDSDNNKIELDKVLYNTKKKINEMRPPASRKLYMSNIASLLEYRKLITVFKLESDDDDILSYAFLDALLNGD